MSKVMNQVFCPRCGQQVDLQSRQCPNCGIGLAWAVALAQEAVKTTMVRPDIPITPEILVPRLGEYLIERGVLSEEDLQRALAYSRDRTATGERQLLGQALLELKLVDREMLDQVITEQILQLQDALQQSNRQLERRVQERTQELQRALNKLAELNQLKSNFVANVSHELRTPMTHIKGYLDLIAEQALGPLTSEQEEAISVIIRSSQRLEELIEELIQFSLASGHELNLELSIVNLNDLVQQAAHRAEVKAQAKSINLDLRLQPNLPRVRVDTDKVRWVLIELIDNGIKFSPNNATIHLSTFCRDRLVTVMVEDMGIGISEGRIAEIFEPFHQLDGSATRRYGGVGLGLALVRQIIESHGSTVRVYSKEGQGTRFEFDLSTIDD
jgi:signal transduction histidine kinase